MAISKVSGGTLKKIILRYEVSVKVTNRNENSLRLAEEKADKYMRARFPGHPVFSGSYSIEWLDKYKQRDYIVTFEVDVVTRVQER